MFTGFDFLDKLKTMRKKRVKKSANPKKEDHHRDAFAHLSDSHVLLIFLFQSMLEVSIPLIGCNLIFLTQTHTQAGSKSDDLR